jgi:5-methylcytosine-specific restriction endonuclease McrA
MITQSYISLPTLVLNKSWSPVSICTAKKAIAKTMLDLARILDPETYILYNFENWMELPVRENDKFIRTSKNKIRVPEIIVLSEYERFPQREVKLTRRNLLIRDNYTCQYTGKRISMDNGTIDHVIPRSRGGTSTWENLVMSCLEVNSKKADRTPDEAGLKLLKKPEKPKWSPIYARFARLASANVPISWHQFVKIEGNPFGALDAAKT